TDDLVSIRKPAVFLEQDIQQYIGMRVVGHEDSLLFLRIFFFELLYQPGDPFFIFFKCIAEVSEDQFIAEMEFPAGVHESADTAGGRRSIRYICVYMDKDIAAAFA